MMRARPRSLIARRSAVAASSAAALLSDALSSNTRIITHSPPVSFFHARLLQSEFLAGRQQRNRLADPLFPGLGPLGHVNPHDIVAPVGGGQRLKVLPGFAVRLERPGHV